jgi:LysR family transcriptional regulator, regulator for bpeEF and oprC
MKNLRQFVNFTAVARHGSFTQAARELGLAPSSVSTSVARLEEELGMRLFNRTTRSVQLTEEGQQLYAKCSKLLAEIEALDLTSSSDDDTPSGTLRIGAPIGYGTRVMLPMLADMRSRYPALEFDLRLSDEQVNMVSEQLDVVVRFGTLRDSSMIARQFDLQDLVLCATPGYLASHPRIRRVSDLHHHVLVAFRLPTTGRDRPLEFLEGGKAVSVAPSSSFRISHGEALVEAALLGVGLAQVPAFMARHYLESGALAEVLPQCRPAPLPVNLVMPSARGRPARVQALVDLLASGVSSSPSGGHLSARSVRARRG